MSWTETVERYLREGRTVSGGKGGNSQNEMNQANQVSQQQFNLMQQQMQSVNSVLNPLIQNGGMMPAQQQSLTAIGLNNIPQQVQGVAGNINDQLVARGITGGNMAGSGDIARNFAGLGAMEAGLQQNVLSNVQLQKQQQLMSALGMQAGMAGMFNQGGLSALGSGVSAAGNADQAQTSWMGPVFGALGSIGGAALGKGGALAGCWIARAVYGDDSPKWLLVRDTLYRDAEQSYPHRLLLALYIAIGEPLAWFVKRSKILKAIFRYGMDRYVR